MRERENPEKRGVGYRRGGGGESMPKARFELRTCSIWPKRSKLVELSILAAPTVKPRHDKATRPKQERRISLTGKPKVSLV